MGVLDQLDFRWGLKQLFFIEGQFLGESPRTHAGVHEDACAPMSALFFCVACGEAYAKAPVVYNDGRQSQWQSHSLCCRKCSPAMRTSLVPGSIWLSWDSDFIAAFPDAVLLWELQRHLDFAERKLHVEEKIRPAG